MGLMTFEEMQQDVSLNLGGKAPDPTRLKRWVNYGYLNLSSFIHLYELETVSALAIADGNTEITAPTDLLGVVSIRIWDATTDPISKKRHLKKMKKEFDWVTATQPTHYKLRGTKIVLWPESDDAYVGEIEYIKIPTALSATSDVTVINSTWDVALVMLATHHAMISLGRKEEGDHWLGRFLGYVSSRLTNDDISADAPSGGLDVAWTWDDVHETPDRAID